MDVEPAFVSVLLQGGHTGPPYRKKSYLISF
jgi:hypothetical protein